MQMCPPSSIEIPSPWYSASSASACSGSNMPTPTSENPTASFGSFASMQSSSSSSEEEEVVYSIQDCLSSAYVPNQEIAWSAATLHSSFSAHSLHSEVDTTLNMSEHEDIGPVQSRFRGPSHSGPAMQMERQSSCSYDSKTSAPSHLLYGTFGGAGM